MVLPLAKNSPLFCLFPDDDGSFLSQEPTTFSSLVAGALLVTDSAVVDGRVHHGKNSSSSSTKKKKAQRKKNLHHGEDDGIRTRLTFVAPAAAAFGEERKDPSRHTTHFHTGTFSLATSNHHVHIDQERRVRPK
jgi:hypothetical protein